MDFDWLFHLGEDDLIQCSNADFPINMMGIQCDGLHQVTTASNISQCRDACCADISCATYQWCPSNTTNGNGCNPPLSCWIGAITQKCFNNTSWISMGRPTPAPPTGPITISYNDSLWKKVNTPHDFAVNTGAFNPNNDIKNGYLPKNTSWYRKHFKLNDNMKNKTIWIDFDGIYRNSDTYLNGIFVGNHQSGYTSFRYYISNNKSYNLQYGNNSNNVLAVRVDPTHDEGWWYEGGGIYRHVFLNSANYLHVVPWGCYINYSVSSIHSNNININSIKAIIQTNITNDRTVTATFSLKTDIVDLTNNSLIATNTLNALSLSSGEYKEYAQVFNLNNVHLWSLDNRSMYIVNSTIIDKNGGEEVDNIQTRFGFRKTTYDPNNGFFLNDKYIKIKGWCNHQDFAGCGVAVPDRVNRFRVETLKGFGSNGWRMSHNPPNPELLDFTDEYGILVWDENRNFANTSQFLQDQADMIQRDRNHPSIIFWSLCNEGGCMEGDINGGNVGKMFEDVIHRYDTMRPISAALNIDFNDSLSTTLNVEGINYAYNELDVYHKQYPNQPIVSSESCSVVTDRKEYVMNATSAHVSSFDCDRVCAWQCWQPIQNRKFVMGSFGWTGFDYKGEPHPYQWPDVNSHYGIIDIAGYPKDNYFYYKSWFKQNETTLHIIPSHWNWNENQWKSDNMKIWVYSNTYYVELFLNGKSIEPGMQEMAKYDHLVWNLDEYENGTLLAIGYNINKTQIINKTLETTNKAYSIKLIMSYPSDGIIYSDGQDVALIEAQIIDNKNRFIGTANNLITFSIKSGPAQIYGVGNGDPSSHEPDKAMNRTAFHGQVRVIINSLLNKSGQIVLSATSDGLQSDVITITSKQPPYHVLNTIVR